jgi:hypothetical protein
MDQPGNSHFALHMGHQSLNGNGGYNGRAYEASGYDGSDNGASRSLSSHPYMGYAEVSPADYHAAADVPEARTPADASIDSSADTGQQASVDDVAHDATVSDGSKPSASKRRRAPASTARADTETVQPDPKQGSEAQEADGPATGAEPGSADLPGAATQRSKRAATGGDASSDSDSDASAADRMRELLARSTMDHAATERATATALNDIRKHLGDLENSVTEIRERAASEPGIASLVAEQLAPQAQRLAGMAATLDGLTAGLSAFGNQLSVIDGRLASTDTRLGSADAKLTSTESRVAALDTRFERLDERLDDQYDRVASIDGQVASMSGRLASTDRRVMTLGGQFMDATVPLTEELRARPIRAEIEEMVTKVVEAAHGDLSGRLTSLEDTILTLAEALLRPAPGHAPG